MTEGRRGKWRIFAVLALTMAALTSCGPDHGIISGVIEEYLVAVQTEDIDALFCLSSGAAGSSDLGPAAEDRRSAFETWAMKEYESYYHGRVGGMVELNSSPIVLAKAFTLGKGTFYSIEKVRQLEENAVEAEMLVRFAYGDINITGLSPGTTFYVCGPPLGTVHPVMIPRRPGQEERLVLDTVAVRWTLLRQSEADGCAPRWTINSAEPVEGTETTDRLVWMF